MSGEETGNNAPPNRTVPSDQNTPGSRPDNPIDNPEAWVRGQIDDFFATDGATVEPRVGAPLLLLTTKGRRSGQWRRTALIYGEDNGRYLVVGSVAGAPGHPAWYLNLVEHPEVHLRVGATDLVGKARTAGPDEKPALWQKMTDIFFDYPNYQAKTAREIPLVIIEPEIPSA